MQNKKPFMVLGLGNPGKTYEKTRHNAGFLVLDDIASRFRSRFKKKWGTPYYYCMNNYLGEDVILIKPRAYMNNSGHAVLSAITRFGVDINDIAIVVDDVWLPFGAIRIRKKGSDGGHNGLASIIQALSTEQFIRCRIGIGGATVADLAEYVLDKFTCEEEKLLKQIISRASDAIMDIIANGVSSAMNKYNSAISAGESCD